MLAMASYQPTTILNVTPPSRASLAPTGKPFLSLLAMASYQPTTILNVTPSSRASLAPTGEPFSQLARDGVVSADNNFECNAVIAGKSGRRIARSYRPTCALLFVGAELARDGVVSADNNFECNAAIAGKPCSYR
ncbi:hypothetical protein [Pseudomonas putida]|uniref:hypothetical protein n=1 Tax=Pseudomonas putida TaxID=303 RepID=UPI003D99BDFB